MRTQQESDLLSDLIIRLNNFMDHDIQFFLIHTKVSSI
jgi:hypothetical protein